MEQLAGRCEAAQTDSSCLQTQLDWHSDAAGLMLRWARHDAGSAVSVGPQQEQ